MPWLTRQGTEMKVVSLRGRLSRRTRCPTPNLPETLTLSNSPNHFDDDGHVHMVDVSKKMVSVRYALAAAEILMQQATAHLIRSGDASKGDVLGVARLAAIQATKATHQLIPLCHAIPIESVTVEFVWGGQETDGQRQVLRCEVAVRSSAKTGVEMEALTAVSIACLTVYDMVKAVDRAIQIRTVHLLEKSGGKTGDFRRD